MFVGDGHDPYELNTDDFIPAIQLASMFYPNETLAIENYISPFSTLTSKIKNPDGTWNLSTTAQVVVPC